MAASNDRKISQLPLLTEVKDDSTFLVVSNISTTPKNERINTQTLFNQVPVSVTVGKELSGKDVIFNTTLSAANRFYFDSSSGDLNLGRNLTVANSVTVTNDLTVNGTVYFGAINPNFVNLDITGNFTSNGSANVGTTLLVSGESTFSENVTASKHLTVSNNLTVAGATTLTGNLAGEHIISNTANISTLTVTNSIAGAQSISSVSSFAENIVANNTITANGSITSVGNITGNAGSLTSLNVTSNGQVGNRLTVQNLTTQVNADIDGQVTANNVVANINLTSPAATITTLNTTTLNATDFESTNNINALAITTVNLAVDTFSISTLDATTLTSNTINANNVISPDISVSNLKMSIITTLPDANTIPDGTMVLYFNAGNYSLQVAAGTPPARYWRSVFLGNP